MIKVIEFITKPFIKTRLFVFYIEHNLHLNRANNVRIPKSVQKRNIISKLLRFPQILRQQQIQSYSMN